jgi:hypothetical protein
MLSSHPATHQREDTLMFGIRFIKSQPTTYLLQYANGKLKREGQGLAFFFFAPTASLVAVPLESADVPFIFNEVTADYQEITIQGELTYRVADAKKLAQLINFTLDSAGRSYVSDDPHKLPQRLIHQIQVSIRSHLRNSGLRDTLRLGDQLVQAVLNDLREAASIKALGVEAQGLSILAIKPNPETARALEAETREQLLQRADEAIYTRRNAAVEQERAIRENELNTEIAVENKKRQIREAQMDAERAVQEKQWELQSAEMAARVELEQQKKQLVMLAAENLRQEADAKAYSLAAAMKALQGVDVQILRALADVGMEPAQLMAAAFREMADGAAKIGELNVSPDLLRELLDKPKGRK